MARHVHEREVEQGRESRRIQMSALDKAPGPPGLPIPRFIAGKASA